MSHDNSGRRNGRKTFAADATTSEERTVSDALLLEHKGLGKVISGLLKNYITTLSSRLNDCGYTEIRPVHLKILREVGFGGVTVSSVASASNMTKQAASQMLKELANLAYLKVVIDPQNKRSRLVFPTERGTLIIFEIRNIIADMQHEMIKELGEPQFECMVSGLLKLQSIRIWEVTDQD